MKQGSQSSGDILGRAVSQDGSASVMVVVATELVAEAVATRPTSVTAAGALGRALMGALLMAASKKSGETIQIQLRGKGPLGTVTAIADSELCVRGTLTHRETELPLRADGRPDVSQGVGRGVLGIVRHHPSWKEPYSGFVPMTLRDIAKDLTRYLMESEQAPSALGLSMVGGDGGEVGAAAAFLVQALPGSDDATLAELEANVKALPEFASLVADGGANVDGLLDRIAGDVAMGERSYDTPAFHCPCSRERASRSLQLLEPQELRELIASGQSQEVACQFCGVAYDIGPDELLVFLEP